MPLWATSLVAVLAIATIFIALAVAKRFGKPGLFVLVGLVLLANLAIMAFLPVAP
jgi:hypothetical protein